MILYDFVCTHCNTVFEDLVPSGTTEALCACNYTAFRMMPAPKTFTAIVPTSLHSKKRKAGFVHSHGDRPKTPGKIQVAVP